jgi:hypothetical protein
LTTKKTIEENTKKTIELRYQSNQIEWIEIESI